MADDFLPDSRSRAGRDAVRGPDGTYVPIYCAQCGKKWGMVPEKFITFVCCLCDPCSEKMGPIAHLYKEPDSVFWARVAEAQHEEHARLLNPAELAIELDNKDSTLSKLAAEWRAKVHKTE